MEKKVKCRKDYKCDHCVAIINLSQMRLKNKLTNILQNELPSDEEIKQNAIEMDEKDFMQFMFDYVWVKFNKL